MYVVAITGGIGSGKTTVANQFAELGIEVVDADVIAREVVEPGTPALATIAAHFGSDVITPAGQLNRRRLRERVFTDPQAKGWLNALLHPLIRTEMQRQCAAARSPYCLLVVPLLVENRLTALANRVLVIDVDEATQIERTCRRDGVSREQAQAILTAQASRAERLAAADDVLDNQNGTPEAIKSRILALHETYLAFASQQARQL
ncbi:dephospho-CoA kinase [Aeromonas hydrophila]|uniref:Dephospho-CoA kinase n=1 Tax=Aeromonas hydrophila subsp. hydrophila (strain ATCC 7966 / DSM 30187 / BCRC 13018 / CCUG 14551 / JCM 1027 / KCTC 2358 / NCIMB 9240 / NCTC 8049) TaxID=380703 RepID=A0KPW0_AERHH|nr:dephospho-CoA kinase [Aeromonas hydrophila]ABK39751.1 dephospho-CoA kinase [Aeromonas hydrophila subsp. hydrophila ATCC 7966]MBS4672447.1 dephospho-CoA kinase [Aeromonas hydrophila]OOD35044.1 dephospho-CoA kinase [Aeromonas hydrophila]SUU32812.1 dephospho-CoA kinase [Aeromonas hydrophila]